MVTTSKDTTVGETTETESAKTREWYIFAFRAFSRICARKHGIAVPELNFDDFSNEEIEIRLRLVSELAHLPPA